MKSKKCGHKAHKGVRLLPLDKFSRHPDTVDGYQSTCKACNAALATKRAKRLKREKAKAKGYNVKKDYHEPRVGLDYTGGYVDDFVDTSPLTDIGDL